MSRAALAVMSNWAMFLSLAGCNLTVLTPSPADRLREENAALEADVASLERMLEESRAQFAAIEANRRDDEIDPEAWAAMPRLTGLEVSGSSVVEVAPDGRGVLMARIVPRDGRGRFLQITGRVSVQASVMVEGFEPVLVGSRSFTPGEVRDAWRSGFFGTIYLFEVPIEIPADSRSATEASVLASFHDAVGGGTFSRLANVSIAIDAAAPAASESGTDGEADAP